MFRIWLTALVLLAGAPLFAAEPADTTKTDTILKKLDEVLTRLNNIESDRREAAREIRDLKRQVDLLQTDVADMRAQMNGQRSTSAKFGPAMIPAPLGTFRVVNEYFAVMRVHVNGATYEMMPGETRDFTVPAGSFSYQVEGVHMLPVTRAVAGGGLYPIRIRPLGF